MRTISSRLIGLGVAAMALLAATVLLPASTATAAAATVRISGSGTGFAYCLNHNASAVKCDTTSDRWLFTVADPARNSWRILAAAGSWTTCLERQAGTDHLRLATCAWNAGQLWVPFATNGYNMLRNDGTDQCIEMNRTRGNPNGVVTVTRCLDYAPQFWTWTDA
jgi:hypothetical protein